MCREQITETNPHKNDLTDLLLDDTLSLSADALDKKDELDRAETESRDVHLDFGGSLPSICISLDGDDDEGMGREREIPRTPVPIRVGNAAFR